jgi:proline iminopeptidase
MSLPTEMQPVTYWQDPASGIKQGGVQLIPITTPKGQFNVWTKHFGNNPRIKVLLLNGGPGATHEYLQCLESFLPQDGIEFIYYDQLDTGNSATPQDAALWSLARYVEEVEQVRQALQLDSSNFYLFGHAWGGILAVEYALQYQQHLKGLIISNMMMSIPAHNTYVNEVLAKQLPSAVLAEIRQFESAQDLEAPRYREMLFANFYSQHVLRLPPSEWPEPLNRSFARANHGLYIAMRGHSEFGIYGELAQWDRTKDLPQLQVPVLAIGGKYDTMDPAHMRWIATQVQDGTALICPNGSHFSMYDDQVAYMSGLTTFILGVDKGEKRELY